MLEVNEKASVREIVGWLSLLVFPPALYFLGVAYALTVQAALFVSILAVVILMWLFNLVDDYIPPLLGMVASLLFGLAPAPVALSGLSSPSLITLMGVFALAAVLTSSGLARRFVLTLLSKFPNRFFLQQNILVCCGFLLSVVSPSGNSRVALMLPLFKEMSDAMHLPKRGRAITALMAATYGGAMLFSTALSNSKSASIAALSMLPVYLQDQYLGVFWIVAASVPMIILLLMHFISMRIMFSVKEPIDFNKEDIVKHLKALGLLSEKERIAGVAFIFFFLGSLTSGLHHISTSSIAGMTILLLLLMGAFNKVDFQRSMDWPIIFFLLGMDSMMRTMAHLGLSQ